MDTTEVLASLDRIEKLLGTHQCIGNYYPTLSLRDHIFLWLGRNDVLVIEDFRRTVSGYFSRSAISTSIHNMVVRGQLVHIAHATYTIRQDN